MDRFYPTTDFYCWCKKVKTELDDILTIQCRGENASQLYCTDEEKSVRMWNIVETCPEKPIECR
jgi:hypothetical protein